jgi:hypothetical protein
VLRIWNVYPVFRILAYSISDPTKRREGNKINRKFPPVKHKKRFESIAKLTKKKFYQLYEILVESTIRNPEEKKLNPDLGSRGQNSIGSRIRIPNTE